MSGRKRSALLMVEAIAGFARMKCSRIDIDTSVIEFYMQSERARDRERRCVREREWLVLWYRRADSRSRKQWKATDSRFGFTKKTSWEGLIPPFSRLVLLCVATPFSSLSFTSHLCVRRWEIVTVDILKCENKQQLLSVFVTQRTIRAVSIDRSVELSLSDTNH